MQQHFERHLG